MPYRAAGILMALAGLVAVVGLIIVGIDVYTAKERGPCWKRRLLGAGLAVLGIFGIGIAARPRPRPTCYLPAIVPCTAPSFQRLSQQLSILDGLAADGKIEPETVRKALASAEAALAEAAKPEVLHGLSPNERYSAGVLIQAARTTIDQLKARLDANPPPAASLEESADWKVITDAWDFAMPFARSGQSTEAQRKEVDAKLAAAREAAARLVGAGLLSEREAQLLNSEADTAVKDIQREPPIGIKCYLMVYVPPARLSLQSIAARLPAIEMLAKGDKVHPASIRKVLDAIEADLVTLSDPKRLAELGDTTSKADADKLRETIKAQVEKLRKLLAGGQAP
jgi:hypothetical protein